MDIDEILGIFSLEEILEMNDMTPEECLEVLVKHGYVFLDDFQTDEESELSDEE